MGELAKRLRIRGGRRSLVAALALLAVVGGCYKATFVRDVPPAGPVQSEWAAFYLLGLVGVHELDVRDYCPDGDVRVVRTGSNVATGALTLVSLGIYAPRKVWIQCGATPPTAPRAGDGEAPP